MITKECLEGIQMAQTFGEGRIFFEREVIEFKQF